MKIDNRIKLFLIAHENEIELVYKNNTNIGIKGKYFCYTKSKKNCLFAITFTKNIPHNRESCCKKMFHIKVINLNFLFCRNNFIKAKTILDGIK